jgi:hypothetical protein
MAQHGNQRERCQHGSGDLIWVTSSVQTRQCAHEHARDEQHLSNAQRAIQPHPRLRQFRVYPMSMDDVTEGHAEMVEQSQFEHRGTSFFNDDARTGPR